MTQNESRSFGADWGKEFQTEGTARGKTTSHKSPGSLGNAQKFCAVEDTAGAMRQSGELGSDSDPMKVHALGQKQWETNSGIKPDSDVIVFSFLKKEHSSDYLNPYTEKTQGKIGSKAVSCLSLGSFCNYHLPLIPWMNAILTTVFPSQQSPAFHCTQGHGEKASKGTNSKHPSPVLNNLHRKQ